MFPSLVVVVVAVVGSTDTRVPEAWSPLAGGRCRRPLLGLPLSGDDLG